MSVHLLWFWVLLFGLIGSIFAQTNNRTFPKDFSFGAATAAFQIEGAWDEDLKGESIWDHYVHTNPSKIKNNDSADISCDSYHKLKEDVAMAVNLNLSHYKFSISWTRLLPSEPFTKINLKGLMYYQNLINDLEQHNITPVVTMYHWDLPQSIQEIGGWTNPDIVDYFKDYAKTLFDSFSSVKYWITINEPKQVCVGGYGKASKAPGLNDSGISDYNCTYNVIKAHTAVYKLYQENYAHNGGKISIGLDCAWTIPATDSEADQAAAERKRLFDFGIYAHPLLIGDWPHIVKQRVNNRSHFENRTESRLPSFTKEEIKEIKNSLDFVTLNFYDTKIVADIEEPPYDSISLDNDIRISTSVNSSWSIAIDGNSIYPAGLRSMLKWLKDTYNNPEIFIGENGIADNGLSLNDYDRIYYLSDYLNAVLDSIHTDNVTVLGYTMWSLMDNFEWTNGYSLHFGIYSVNFTDTNRTRTPKLSADYYHNLIKDRKIPSLPDTSPAPSTTSTISTTSIISTSTETATSTISTTSSTEQPNGNHGTVHRNFVGSFLLIFVVSFCFLIGDYYI